MVTQFSKILIANRGEIAVRIIRAATELGIETVAIFTHGEEKSLHVQKATASVSLGDGALSETYLNIQKIVDIALETGAEAIHPGYGFLSENPDFAKSCKENGLVFIGPSEEVLRKMGNKVAAKAIAQKVGVNVLLGRSIHLESIEQESATLHYPLLVKAAFGGGGKGMQIVWNADELVEKVTSASRSAKSYFGDGEIFVEHFVKNARHIEVQVLGDSFANLIHLYERDCTVQRNHQKIIEEAPATSISNELRSKIHAAALAVCTEIGYENAGTVEFLVDVKENFFFIEMNPRIQVEHTVTEQITGIDIVKAQLFIAAGNRHTFSQKDVVVKDHSIEARLYAEDPLRNFEPSGKTVQYFQFPKRVNIRLETDLTNSSVSTVRFDPLLCKLISTGKTREQAIQQMIAALKETSVLGPATNQAYLLELLQSESFLHNRLTTRYCEEHQQELIAAVQYSKEKIDQRLLVAAALLSLFPQKKEVDENVWKNIGFWNIAPSVNLIIDYQNIVVEFERKIGKCIIKLNREVVPVLIVEEKDHFLKLNVNDQVETFSIVKISDSRVLIGCSGYSYEVGSDNFLDFYPQNFDPKIETEAGTSNLIVSHLHGKIVNINVEPHQTISKGDLLMVIESMKSENRIVSPKNAKVKKINVSVGDQVADQMPLIYLEDS